MVPVAFSFSEQITCCTVTAPTVSNYWQFTGGQAASHDWWQRWNVTSSLDASHTCFRRISAISFLYSTGRLYPSHVFASMSSCIEPLWSHLNRSVWIFSESSAPEVSTVHKNYKSRSLPSGISIVVFVSNNISLYLGIPAMTLPYTPTESLLVTHLHYCPWRGENQSPTSCHAQHLLALFQDEHQWD